MGKYANDFRQRVAQERAEEAGRQLEADERAKRRWLEILPSVQQALITTAKVLADQGIAMEDYYAAHSSKEIHTPGGLSRTGWSTTRNYVTGGASRAWRRGESLLTSDGRFLTGHPCSPGLTGVFKKRLLGGADVLCVCSSPNENGLPIVERAWTGAFARGGLFFDAQSGVVYHMTAVRDYDSYTESYYYRQTDLYEWLRHWIESTVG